MTSDADLAVTPAATRPRSAPRPSLLAPEYRLPTIGLVVVITVAAFEGMAVATVMPTAVGHLHGLRLYGWAFTAYFLADIVGMVDAGHRADRDGPTLPLVGGLALFAAGLLVAGLAPDMPVFLAGRVLQGLGGGWIIVAAYVVVARAFPEALRPRAFAAMSAAWVLPALIGPVTAGWLAGALGWRWVFLGIAPLATLGALLLVPVLRRLPAREPSGTRPRLPLWGGTALALGVALLQAAGQRVTWWSALLAVAGAGAALPTLRRALPAGALRLRRGLPTVVVLRGLLSGAFFGAEAYLPLTLSRIHHGTPTEVGLPLTLGAIGWSAGSWWQGHRGGDDRRRRRILVAGFLLVAAGVGSLSVVASPDVSMWVSVPLWLVAGTGMGLAMPTVSVLTLALSPEAEQGANSAALQVCDVTGSVLTIAVGATVVAAVGLGHLGTATVVIDAAMAAVAVAGALASRRAFG